MQTELGAVVWPTAIAITVSIALTIALALRLRKNANRIDRAESVQYLFIATVKASTPQVTYLDFPAPEPPASDHDVVRYEPTILRTFGRTATKLRFSDKVQVQPIPDSPAPVPARQGRARGALQFTPIADAPKAHDDLLSHPTVSRRESTAGPTATVRRGPTPGPATTVRRDPTPGAPAVRRDPTPGPPAVRRDPTPGPPATRRDPTPGPPAVRRDPTPGPSNVTRDTTSGVAAVRRGPTPGLGPFRHTSSSPPPSDNELSDHSQVNARNSTPSYSVAADAIRRLVRNKRFSGKIGEGPDAIKVMMYWWESVSPERIQAPPDLSERQELRLGDLFLHRHDTGIQIWIWTEAHEMLPSESLQSPVGAVPPVQAPAVGAQVPTHAQADAAHEQLNIAHEQLNVAHEQLNVAHEQLNVAHEELGAAHEELGAAHEELGEALNTAREELGATHDALDAAQEELSTVVRTQNSNMLRLSRHWEQEVTTALQGLEDMESVADALQRGVLELKRKQDIHMTRQKQLEEDNATLRASMEDFFDVVKVSNASLRKQHQVTEDLREHCLTRHDVVRDSVGKAERDIVALHGQLQNNRQAVTDLLEQLESTQQVSHSWDTRLTEVEHAVAALWDLLKDVRETLHVLSTCRETLELFSTPGCLSPRPSLEDEVRLSATGSQEPTDVGHATSRATVDEDGWWNFKASSPEPSPSRRVPSVGSKLGLDINLSSPNETPLHMTSNTTDSSSEPVASLSDIESDTGLGFFAANDRDTTRKLQLAIPTSLLSPGEAEVGSPRRLTAPNVPISAPPTESFKNTLEDVRDSEMVVEPHPPLPDPPKSDLKMRQILNIPHVCGAKLWVFLFCSTVCIIVCYHSWPFSNNANTYIDIEVAIDDHAAEYPVWEWALQRT
ncbi:hypothetical protein GSI_12595 [Ganoderma sinense ZZ0214-1]|uniref:Uncharacterized protein n=1 Tax=Ganoderma sinense ZZ0214-1 TaxID=1077348 RepID=A0A2G8RT78_9APHY|nr:hypothetical protein GSI_12595 [Ganoderma sinense ZZ0214-1]